jgi:hypothetical protein
MKSPGATRTGAPARAHCETAASGKPTREDDSRHVWNVPGGVRARNFEPSSAASHVLAVGFDFFRLLFVDLHQLGARFAVRPQELIKLGVNRLSVAMFRRMDGPAPSLRGPARVCIRLALLRSHHVQLERHRHARDLGDDSIHPARRTYRRVAVRATETSSAPA